MGRQNIPSIFVYVVTVGEYSDYHIDRIFTNYGAAEKYASKTEGARVEQFEVDTSGRPSAQLAYTVTMARDDKGVTDEGEVEHVSLGALWGIGVSRLRGAHFSVSIMARDEAHAVEIAREMRRGLIAEDKW